MKEYEEPAAIVEEFRGWVLEQTSPDYRMYCLDNTERTIVLETDYCRGEVAFYPSNIVQLSVVNKLNDENLFYLHFQIHTLDHAKNLFEEMQGVVESLTTRPKTHILLSCSSGMTTGYFAEKMNQAAQLLNLSYEFSAAPYSNLYRMGCQSDAIFLAPQISYQVDAIREALQHSCVYSIPPRIFASYDVQQFLDFIEECLREKADTQNAAEFVPLSPRYQERIHHQILSIALIRQSEDRFAFTARLYDVHGAILYNEDIIKRRLSIDDICDVCDTAFAHHPDIHSVCLAMPGIIGNGRVTLKRLGLDHTDLVGILTKKYGKHFFVSNDANCIAMGYYASQDKVHSLSLLFQPLIGNLGGMGSIVNGQLIRGYRNVAGEVQYMSVTGGATASPLWETPEGARRLAAELISGVISILGPELILVSSRLLWDTEKLRAEILRYVPENYIPPLQYINNAREYMLLGATITCVHRMEEQERREANGQ